MKSDVTMSDNAALLNELVQISRHYGADPSMVLSGGGNTSAKTAGRLFVKGSGRALADVTVDSFVELDRAKLQSLLESTPATDSNERERHFANVIMASRLEPQKNQRPSVECVLHHMLPRTFVVHTHATITNMIGCAQDAEALVRELYGDDVLWVPYVDPGFVLAKTLHEALKAYKKRTGKDCPPAVLMQNHGLVVSADTTEEIRRITAQIIAKAQQRLDQTSAADVFGPVTRLDAAAARTLINTFGPALRGLCGDGEALPLVNFDDSSAVLQLVGAARGREAALAGPMIPDQIVYAGGLPLWFEPAADEQPANTIQRLRAALEQHKNDVGQPATIVLVKSLGLFTIGRDWTAVHNARVNYLNAVEVMIGAQRLGGIHPMTKAQRLFIQNWEVENYRKSVAARQSAGRVVGKVAVVTGAAQGFGLEISQSFASAGGCVALADMNVEGARKAAEQINKDLGAGRAMGLVMNVTDGGSVEQAMHEVVRMYGGFDVFISNAGVLKAGSVKTQSEKDFDFVTAVNYKGYFVCVQKAAPILAMQHAACPAYWSDIIQINSKSGLQGSNKNGAYAGSKFGGIGLTQSFAMELVEDGIKVNSICPGNFFDGPLWSDPKTGLFVQYLNTGKVPGAKTIADVKRFYEAKVPMNRGCTTADVMKAVFYLMDQKYETGQAVPVTGGQVMLK